MAINKNSEAKTKVLMNVTTKQRGQIQTYMVFFESLGNIFRLVDIYKLPRENNIPTKLMRAIIKPDPHVKRLSMLIKYN